MTLPQMFIVALVVAGILPLAYFIYRYWRYSPYKLNAIGKTLMRQKWALVSVLVLVLAARLLGDYWGREVITILLYGFLVAMFWRTLFELLSVQKKHPGFDRLKGSSEAQMLHDAHVDNDRKDDQLA